MISRSAQPSSRATSEYLGSGAGSPVAPERNDAQHGMLHAQSQQKRQEGGHRDGGENEEARVHTNAGRSRVVEKNHGGVETHAVAAEHATSKNFLADTEACRVEIHERLPQLITAKAGLGRDEKTGKPYQESPACQGVRAAPRPSREGSG